MRWFERSSHDDDDGEFDDGRRRVGLIAALALIVVALVFFGLRLVSQFGDDEPRAAPQSPGSSGSASDQTAVTVVVETIGSPAVATTPPPTSTTTRVASLPPPGTNVNTVARGPLTIQVVPPMRDLLVRIGDEMLTSDANGRIVVPAEQRADEIEFVGLRTTPPLHQVELMAWSDGVVDPVRSLNAITSSMVQIGIEVRSHVIVTGAATIPQSGFIRFVSTDGSIDLPLNAAQWVPSSRAVGTKSGMVSEYLVYTAEAVVLDGTVTLLPYQEFTAEPEAKWHVTS